ncbi:MAG: cell division protein ZapD [Burkholderia sp.]|nr:cell division protein ZapD [Burkholderia sp.]
MVLYEYPFNERIRILLRLEDLFERLTFFLLKEDAREHHVALITLFEITEVIGRTDLKSELTKELERQRQALLLLRADSNIKQNALEVIISEIEQTIANLTHIYGRIGHHIINNEWLASICNRTLIPGGTCKFDLPSYYAWQQFSAEHRRSDIEKWISPLLPLRNAILIILRLSRESGKTSEVIAIHGIHQQMLYDRSYKLMQIRVAPDSHIVPEASINKYMLWIRLTIQNNEMRPQVVDTDVSFQLTLCNL